MAGKYRRRNSSPSDLLKRIRGQILKFFFFFDRFDFRLVLTLFPSDFTLAVVEDLGNGRSPVLSIDRFSNYCSKSNDSWFDFFFPFRLNVISVSLAL